MIYFKEFEPALLINSKMKINDNKELMENRLRNQLKYIQNNDKLLNFIKLSNEDKQTLKEMMISLYEYLFYAHYNNILFNGYFDNNNKIIPNKINSKDKDFMYNTVIPFYKILFNNTIIELYFYDVISETYSINDSCICKSFFDTIKMNY